MRLRLTALYCALFFPLGVALVVISSVVTFLSLHPASLHPVAHLHEHGHGATVVPSRPNQTGVAAVTPAYDVHIGSLNLDLHEFVLGACITLAVMIGISLLLGWLLAGRALRPLRTITDTTQSISEHDLHRRLALPGPRDELTELGDTIDGLLGRLERAFDSQRRFVANASHELRTPLTVDRATLQVALADPDVTIDSLRAACAEVLEAGREQERLIDALLTLARSQRGLDHKEPVDLTAVTNEVLHALEASAATRGLQVDASLEAATVTGDARLLYQLVSNLVDNAIRHNIANGHVQVALAASTAEATLAVTNTGPLVGPDQISRLLQPFQRGTPDRTATSKGLGLGLSIVADIAEAHAASLDVLARPEGGLAITVTFPANAPTRSQDRR
ncbi:MAG: HAMP domain-containing sensor histidine kinase [Acidimicrobiales bacterium]